jgi:hypothetical protein
LKASQTSRLGMSNGLALSTEFLPLPVLGSLCRFPALIFPAP